MGQPIFFCWRQLEIVIAACHMHCIHLHWSYVMIYGHDRTGTASCDAAPYLVGYAGRRQYALHSFALLKSIGTVELLLLWSKLQLVLNCSLFVLHRYYTLSVIDEKFYVKSLLNSTRGSNSLSKQLPAEMFHLTLALLLPDAWCLS